MVTSHVGTTHKKTGAFFASSPKGQDTTKRGRYAHIRPGYRGQDKAAGQKFATPGAFVKATVLGAFPCIGQTETRVVVAITGCVVVAIRHTAVLRVVVPRPAALDTVGA